MLLRLSFILFFIGSVAFAMDPLPSWSEGANKASIIRFVEKVTNPKSLDYVAPAERIAVFDNDGTLMSEQPLYFQLQFTVEQIQALWSQYPDWKNNPNFVSVKDGRIDDIFTKGSAGANIGQLVMQLNASLDPAQFDNLVLSWLKNTKHPRFNKPYVTMTYKPMIELLDYLKSKGFKNFVVSGSGVNFLRLWTEEAYGIPPEQVIGTNGKLKLEEKNGSLDLVRLPEVNFLNDGPNKVLGIHYQIGRHPIIAVGNSDGDLEMLQWISQRGKAHLSILIHHTDEVREWAYDRNSKIGRLDKALDMAVQKKWPVVDMKNDWKVIY